MTADAIEALIAAEELPADYRQVVDQHWRPLAEDIAVRARGKRPLFAGINGAQGSGKSTLCRVLEVLLAEHGLDPALLSGIGVGLPAPIEHPSGRVVLPSFMPSWHNVSLPSLFAAHTDVPVVVDFVVHRDAMVWPMVPAGVSNDKIQVARGGAPIWDRED